RLRSKGDRFAIAGGYRPPGSFLGEPLSPIALDAAKPASVIGLVQDFGECRSVIVRLLHTQFLKLVSAAWDGPADRQSAMRLYSLASAVAATRAKSIASE